MDMSLTAPRSMRARSLLAIVMLAAAIGAVGSRTSTVTAQAAADLQGLGIVTGTVSASKPFTAAQVYLRSRDARRRMLYMVYTNAGAFKAVAVMPGNYELFVKARGLESDPQPIAVKSGANPAVTVTMRHASDPNAY